LTLRALLVAAILLMQACATPPSTQTATPPAQHEPSPPAVATESVAIVRPAAVPTTPPLEAARAKPFDGEKAVVAERPSIPTVDGTRPRGDVWERIRKGFAMDDLDSALVRKQVAYYTAHPEYLQRVFDRSKLYLYHIVTEIERRGLPTELALLPMVESAFNPMAYSRARASGLWQFIPSTGKRFELEQSWWYDERRDIVDSTNAALDYLTEIYKMHGDWHLALASYNWGENAVSRAIAKNRKAKKPTDYEHLRMPKETRWYVPKLQALKNIIRDPARYGIDLSPIPNEPYFVRVSETPDIDLQLAAKLAEMPVEECLALNPGFNRPLIRSSGGSRIVLPAEKVDVFYENLAKYDPKSLVSWQVYHPKRGETFTTLAKKFSVPIAQLKKVNGVHARSTQMPDVLVVPLREEALEAAKLPVMYAPPIPVRGTLNVVHRVKAGETLAGIAKRYRVTVQTLKRLNRLGPTLHVGQKIYVRKRIR
jgi:membrane-bound lytic murein transglycosylase D